MTLPSMAGLYEASSWSPLAHGRFLVRDDAAAGRARIEKALGFFEQLDATGWIEEARRAL